MPLSGIIRPSQRRYCDLHLAAPFAFNLTRLEMADLDGREEDEAVLAKDILAAQEELEETVTAVLGDSDDKNCSYGQGYVKRQAIYSCATCLSPGDGAEPAAICLACSLECHDGHNLIELYTKRNLRCDCGNSKFSGFKCRLVPDKDPVNNKNVYNQNFSGKYCQCKRPYPDPDDDVEDEMLQCAVCEDWFHTRHLGVSALPREGAYDEMICGDCTSKLDFLRFYVTLAVVAKNDNADAAAEAGQSATAEAAGQSATAEAAGQSATVEAAGQSTTAVKRDHEGNIKPAASLATTEAPAAAAIVASGPSTGNANSTELAVGCVKTEPPPAYTSADSGSTSPTKRSSADATDAAGETCIIVNSAVQPLPTGSATFWLSGWRLRLCKCSACRAVYDAKEVAYLLDESDTLTSYEERGRIKERLKDDALISQSNAEFSSLNRVQQIEILQGVNDLKSGLEEFLVSFAREGKVVRVEDVREFFEELRRKRQRVNVNHYCR